MDPRGYSQLLLSRYKVVSSHSPVAKSEDDDKVYQVTLHVDRRLPIYIMETKEDSSLVGSCLGLGKP